MWNFRMVQLVTGPFWWISKECFFETLCVLPIKQNSNPYSDCFMQSGKFQASNSSLKNFLCYLVPGPLYAALWISIWLNCEKIIWPLVWFRSEGFRWQGRCLWRSSIEFLFHFKSVSLFASSRGHKQKGEANYHQKSLLKNLLALGNSYEY